MSDKTSISLKTSLTALCMLSLIVCTSARADGWVEVGYELAIDSLTDPSNEFAALGMRFNYANDSNLYTLSYREGYESSNFFFDETSFKEITVAYGRHSAYKFGATTIQMGLGIREYGESSSGDNEFSGSTFFVPVSASFILGKYSGLSNSIYLNISRENPTIGIGFGYAVGIFN